MGSIFDFGSYFVILKWKGETEDTCGIKGQIMLEQHSESKH